MVAPVSESAMAGVASRIEAVKDREAVKILERSDFMAFLLPVLILMGALNPIVLVWGS